MRFHQKSTPDDIVEAWEGLGYHEAKEQCHSRMIRGAILRGNQIAQWILREKPQLHD
ncbi:MAG: hypothetical protein ABID54_10985 [Pseudomonadota bacterium]